MRLCPRRIVQNSGQALVEYALILALASLGIVSVLMILQRSLSGTMLGTGQKLDATTGVHAGQPRPGEPLAGKPEGASSPAKAKGHGGNDRGAYGNAAPKGRK